MGYVLGQFVVIISDRYCTLPLAPLCPTLLSPLWANPAEILRGKWARIWLRMMQILLGTSRHVGASVEKPSKTDDFGPFFARVDQWRGQLLGPSKVGQSGASKRAVMCSNDR